MTKAELNRDLHCNDKVELNQGFLVAVVVVMMLFRAFDHWDHAAVGYFADYVLELNCGVDDVEVVMQALFYVAQDALAD
jgi:hypothetical protein